MVGSEKTPPCTRLVNDTMLHAAFVAPGGESEHILVSFSYHCLEFRPEVRRPFPTRRREDTRWNYVAVNDQIGHDLSNWPNRTCPPECRPAAHQDWTKC